MKRRKNKGGRDAWYSTSKTSHVSQAPTRVEEQRSCKRQHSPWEPLPPKTATTGRLCNRQQRLETGQGRHEAGRWDTAQRGGGDPAQRGDGTPFNTGSTPFSTVAIHETRGSRGVEGVEQAQAARWAGSCVCEDGRRFGSALGF
eukprot:179777-Chlamydomonas_euryale.AAC.2